MVIAPSFAYLHHPSRGWQSLFALTMAVRDKSVQNVRHCDIPATALPQGAEFRLFAMRLFRNSQQLITRPPVCNPKVASPDRECRRRPRTALGAPGPTQLPASAA